MSLTIATVQSQFKHVLTTVVGFNMLGSGQLKHMFRKPLLVVENLHRLYQLGLKLRSLEGKSHFHIPLNHFNVKLLCCVLHIIRGGEIYCISPTYRVYHLHLTHYASYIQHQCIYTRVYTVPVCLCRM